MKYNQRRHWMQTSSITRGRAKDGRMILKSMGEDVGTDVFLVSERPSVKPRTYGEYNKIAAGRVIPTPTTRVFIGFPRSRAPAGMDRHPAGQTPIRRVPRG